MSGICTTGIQAIEAAGWLVTLPLRGALVPGIRASSGGEIPTASSLASCTAIFNGLLYNRRDLEHELEASPEMTESELLVRAYLQWGEDCANRVEGIYSFMVADQRHDKVMCVRDRLGTFPLFYTQRSEELLLSNSVDALINQPGVSRELNRAALADQISHRFPDLQETAYLHIKRIPPGYMLTEVRGTRKVFRYWEPVPPGRPIEYLPPEEAIHFEEVLDRTVNRFLNFGPAGIFLSGGLDSVSVAAAALETSRRREYPVPLALSLGFPGTEANEQPIQKGVAQDLGIPQILEPFHSAIGCDSVLTAALELSRTWPVPLLSPWVPAYHTLARAGKERGCKVVLTGGGGDEWLCVSPRFAADLIRRCDIPGLHRMWTALRRSYSISSRHAAMSLFWRHGFRVILKDLWSTSLVRRSLMAAAAHFASNRVEAGRQERFDRATFPWIAPDPVLRRELRRRWETSVSYPKSSSYYRHDLHLSLDHAGYAIETEEVYENGRRAGVRILRPYWDAELVTFLTRTSPHVLNSGGRTKSVVRQSLARRFPNLGFAQQKKVDASRFFFAEVIRGFKPAWEALGGVPALTELGIVEPQAVKSSLQSVLTLEPDSEAYRVWDVLKLEAWLKPRY